MSKIPENWREILAKNIEWERLRLNLNQNQLANEVGLDSYATVSVWENKRGLPKMDIFEKLCRYFNRTPTEMMYEDLSFKPPPPEPPKNGKTTEGVLQETDVGGTATESPPFKNEEKEEMKKMKKQLLEIMVKLENMDA